ncbi:MAG: hypothetical protein GY808_12785 [Gammaproteobacteria bacterium]|nr:hypothetical protein [Gammaproteobacteria bacterium]
MIDEFGQPLLSQTLELQLDVDNQLEINRSHPALLELDFNLAASHTVNLEVNPVLRKEFRVRGPLIEVNEADLYFRIHVRSFHRKDGRFGNVNMHVAEETNFEIDGEAYSGSAGLTQMAGLSADTPTVSL